MKDKIIISLTTIPTRINLIEPVIDSLCKQVLKPNLIYINIPRKFLAFKKLFKSDNFNRFKCIFLPFDAVLKALK